MRLFIMRHGIAEDLGGAVRRDADRPLSFIGSERTEKIAQVLHTICGGLDVIISSPLLRARQTADLVNAPFKTRREILDCLRPGGDPEEILSQLRTYATDSCLVVGHMPDISILASYCLCSTPARVFMQFQKAAVASIIFSRVPYMASGVLEWLIQPDHLLSLFAGRDEL